jgi:hypothetical protein
MTSHEFTHKVHRKKNACKIKLYALHDRLCSKMVSYLPACKAVIIVHHRISESKLFRATFGAASSAINADRAIPRRAITWCRATRHVVQKPSVRHALLLNFVWKESASLLMRAPCGGSTWHCSNEIDPAPRLLMSSSKTLRLGRKKQPGVLL